MFQFRAFPSYGYLIHRTMTAYCAAVLPHSEISGSTLICSSPKLIAACHVLHRLLMPRHSPCALSSLTCVEENCVPFRPSPGGAEHPLHSVSFSFFAPDPLALGSVARNEETSLSSLWFSIKNYAGSTELLKQNCKLPLKSSTIKVFRCDLSIAPSVALLFTLFPLFSFQGASPMTGMVENSGIEPLTS